MKTLHLPLALVPFAALLAVALPAGAAAPAASAPAKAAASAPSIAAASAPAITAPAPTRSVPQKHLATPQEQRESAAGTNQMRPESRVTAPQINVPINPSGAGKPAYSVPRSGKTATGSGGSVDDSAARCNAIADAQERKDCLAKLR